MVLGTKQLVHMFVEPASIHTVACGFLKHKVYKMKVRRTHLLGLTLGI
jgi:hypothetical protein